MIGYDSAFIELYDVLSHKMSDKESISDYNLNVGLVWASINFIAMQTNNLQLRDSAPVMKDVCQGNIGGLEIELGKVSIDKIIAGTVLTKRFDLEECEECAYTRGCDKAEVSAGLLVDSRRVNIGSLLPFQQRREGMPCQFKRLQPIPSYVPNLLFGLLHNGDITEQEFHLYFDVSKLVVEGMGLGGNSSAPLH